jgi:SNW domain-containing protein 1
MFGDGGAFPEIHVAQYPLNMGYVKNQTSNAIQLQIDADGKPKFDAIVKQNVKGSKVSSVFFFFFIFQSDHFIS